MRINSLRERERERERDGKQDMETDKSRTQAVKMELRMNVTFCNIFFYIHYALYIVCNFNVNAINILCNLVYHE